MNLATGTRLGPYEVLSPLGAGGMGEVYRARDSRLGRDVAVKILPQHLTENPEARQRFEREARAISSLQHPHICTLYDIGHHDGTDFLVMEYLEGETLAKRLERGPLPTTELLRTGIEISNALMKAHQRGILHRDLKPGNIMLTKAGAKLMDFGLAKEITDGEGPNATLTRSLQRPPQPITAQGTIIGTVQYMAPEQIEGGAADARSDIFALGAVLYEMATGQPAFQGKSTASVIAAILEREPPPISTIQPMTPPALDRMVKTCLAKDPDERFQSVHDVKLQLQWLLEPGSQTAASAINAHRRNRERLAWGAAALIALLALALAVAFMRRAPQPAPLIISQITPPPNTDFSAALGTSGTMALSPDGERLAFIALGRDGHEQLWVRALNSPTAQPLDGTDGARDLFWSPDSRSIGFFAKGKLNRIDASGGSLFALADAPRGDGASWSADGTILFAPTLAGTLFRVSASGGASQPVTQLSAQRKDFAHRWPQFLPDGKHFLFFVWSADASTTGVYVGSLDGEHGGEQKLVLRSPSDAVFVAPDYLLFVRDGTLMAEHFDPASLQLRDDAAPVVEHLTSETGLAAGPFTFSDNGMLVYAPGTVGFRPTRLLWFDRTGKQIGETGSVGYYDTPKISPDGRSLAVSIAGGGTHGVITIFDLTTGLKRRLNFSNSFNVAPVWSSDGRTIAFVSNRDGGIHMYQKPADGTGTTTPLFTDKFLQEHSGAPEWTSDGRYLLFFSRRSDQEGVFAMPLFGDRKPFLVLQNVRQFSVSPNGKWIAYVAPSGEVDVSPFPNVTGTWQVSTGAGLGPSWRRDSKEIFYLSPDHQIMAAQVTDEGTRLSVGKVQALFRANIATVAPNAAGDFDISPDGQKFVVVTPVQQKESQPLTLVTNWPALLKK
jgi:Tol biopolymer transport system component/predicted Ser/Thr protein kinase